MTRKLVTLGGEVLSADKVALYNAKAPLAELIPFNDEKAAASEAIVLYEPDDLYHVQFISPPQNGQYAEEDISTFLRRVFNGVAPLAYDQHKLVQVNGKQAVQVSLTLGNYGIH